MSSLSGSSVSPTIRRNKKHRSGKQYLKQLQNITQLLPRHLMACSKLPVLDLTCIVHSSIICWEKKDKNVHLIFEGIELGTIKKKRNTNLIKISQCIICIAICWFSQGSIHFLNKVVVTNKCCLRLVNQILFITKRKT